MPGSVADTFAALADPNRLRMMELLRVSPCTVTEIGERLHLNQPHVSKHLRTLKDAGLVDVTPLAQQRRYELRRESLRQVHEWLERYRQLWEARFDQLDDLLTELNTQAPRKKRESNGRHHRK